MIIQYLLYQIPSFTIHNSHYSNLASMSTIAIMLILLVLMYIFIASQPYHCSITLTNNYILSMNNYTLSFAVGKVKLHSILYSLDPGSCLICFFPSIFHTFCKYKTIDQQEMKASLKFSNANKSI